eukprot:2214215-Rhodomonas_salina.5
MWAGLTSAIDVRARVALRSTAKSTPRNHRPRAQKVLKTRLRGFGFGVRQVRAALLERLLWRAGVPRSPTASNARIHASNARIHASNARIHASNARIHASDARIHLASRARSLASLICLRALCNARR